MVSKVIYATVSFDRDFEPVLENVNAAVGHVDGIVIVEDGLVPFTEEHKKALVDAGAQVFRHPWNDNFPELRNASLDEAQKLGADWVIISDADEHLNAKFWEDLKDKIVPDLEAAGLNMGAIRCFDQFDPIEWWDDLDSLKELPGGSARETSWYKNLLFRLYPDVRYQGVGKEANVHEVWGSAANKWNAGQLPEPYHYVHRKSSLRVWINASRNLYMGGGGDAVGDFNPMWTELRKITDSMGLTNWHAFEEFIMASKPLPSEFIDWIKKALVFSASDYGTETRETGKFAVWYHRELLADPDIEYGIHHTPTRTQREENEMQIRKAYFQVLNRHPDRKGLEDYVAQVESGTLKLEDVVKSLQNSEEYLKQHGEKAKIEVKGELNFIITDEQVIEIIGRSKIWNERLKPALDIGRYVLSQVKDKQEFLKLFYADKDVVTVREPELLIHAGTANPPLKQASTLPYIYGGKKVYSDQSTAPYVYNEAKTESTR